MAIQNIQKNVQMFNCSNGQNFQVFTYHPKVEQCDPSFHIVNCSLLVSVQTPVYSTRAFWKKRPMNRKFDHCVSQKDIMS